MGKSKEFTGRIGRTFADSQAAWPLLDRAPEGAPNIVMVLLDDVGYAQFGCYGSDLATPTFDRLAASGLATTASTPLRSARRPVPAS